MVKLGAYDTLHAVATCEQFGGQKHPERGSREVNPDAGKSPASSADPKVRAGFLLIPERGASTVM